MKVVLTGPATAPYAREYVSNAAATLRQRGHQVFVPHEGGWEAPENPAESDRFNYEATDRALHEADLLIAVLDGYVVDDAVSFQIGVFHELARKDGGDRRIMGLLHDTRIAGWDWTAGDAALTPQIRQAINAVGAVYPNFKAVFAALEARDQG